MTKLQIGTFPGRINDYMVEDGTTVKEALALADLTVGDEQEIKLDGEVVNMNDTVANGNLLLVTKRIKGMK